MALPLPRFIQTELAPFARFFDDLAALQTQPPTPPTPPAVPFCRPRDRHAVPAFSAWVNGHQSNSSGGFTPRFDVKETTDAYELSGEVPGCADVQVEFTDTATLTIRGRSTHSRDTTARPANRTTTTTTTTTDTSTATPVETEPADTVTTADAHQPSVMDADADDEDFVAVPRDHAATPAAASDEAADTPPVVTPASNTPAPEPRADIPPAKYWLAERRVGEFARTFTFPARVEQEAVRASLKEGILSVVVPKATAPATRRIRVE